MHIPYRQTTTSTARIHPSSHQQADTSSVFVARSDVDIELLHPPEPGGATAGKNLSRSIAAAQATGGGVGGSPLG